MGRGHPSRLPCGPIARVGLPLSWSEPRRFCRGPATMANRPAVPQHRRHRRRATARDCPYPSRPAIPRTPPIDPLSSSIITGTAAGQPQGIAPTHPVLPSHAPPRLIPCCHPPYTWEHLSQWAWTRMGSGFTACGIVRNKWNICHNCHNASPCRGATGMEEDRRWIATHTISLFTIPILIYIYNIGIEGDGWRWWR